jgi:hypothetical protein
MNRNPPITLRKFNKFSEFNLMFVGAMGQEGFTVEILARLIMQTCLLASMSREGFSLNIYSMNDIRKVFFAL